MKDLTKTAYGESLAKALDTTEKYNYGVIWGKGLYRYSEIGARSLYVVSGELPHYGQRADIFRICFRGRPHHPEFYLLSMNSGIITCFGSAQELAIHLDTFGFIPASLKELRAMIQKQSKGMSKRDISNPEKFLRKSREL